MEALDWLYQQHLDSPYIWMPKFVMDLWEELWGRWCQEIRLLDTEIARGIEKRQPTFDQIKYYVSIPDAEGYAWFRPPKRF